MLDLLNILVVRGLFCFYFFISHFKQDRDLTFFCISLLKLTNFRVYQGFEFIEFSFPTLPNLFFWEKIFLFSSISLGSRSETKHGLANARGGEFRPMGSGRNSHSSFDNG